MCMKEADDERHDGREKKMPDENLVRSLHEQFMKGEISQGHMAEQLVINRVDLIHLLEAMNLQVTNL